MSPSWHPKGTHLAYSVVGSRGCCQIFVYDLSGGGARRIDAVGGGLNSTPVFAPDGAVIVYTHGEESGTDLFATTVFERGPARRITVGRGSDNTSPTFSPDGRRLAFTSGRLGHPEIYISDADGTNPQPLTYSVGDQNYRANPDWSPDGRLVAYQSQQTDGSFQLNTISLRDRSVKQLTSDGSNEDASWAPDSRHIIFSSTRTGSKQLFVIDSESGRWRQLTRNGGVRLPAWSPPLDAVDHSTFFPATVIRRDHASCFSSHHAVGRCSRSPWAPARRNRKLRPRRSPACSGATASPAAAAVAARV